MSDVLVLSLSAFAGNPAKGLPLIMGIVVLDDAETGQPLAGCRAPIDITLAKSVGRAAMDAAAARLAYDTALRIGAGVRVSL